MEYFEAYGDELARQFCPNGTIKRFANNTAVIGAFAESTVMKFVRSYLAPLHVSTGTVISPEIFMAPDKVPQIDSMIWSPCPLPAIFEADSFALVPRMSCLGILEIKRSNYTKVPELIGRVLNEAEHLVRPLHESEPKYDGYKPALGVICLLERDEDVKLVQMIEDGLVVALSRRKDDQIEPIDEGIHALMRYLGSIRARYQQVVGTTTVVTRNQTPFGRPNAEFSTDEGIRFTSTASGYSTVPRRANCEETKGTGPWL